MTFSKNRLGRGLGALIAGGTPAPKPIQKAAPAVVVKKSIAPSAKKKVAIAPKKAEAKVPAKVVKAASKPTQGVSSKVNQVKASVKSSPGKSVAAKPVAVKAVKVPVVSKTIKQEAPVLISEAHLEHPHYRELAVDHIDPNPHQPRRDIDASKVKELADSIRSEGLLQPVVVRKAGERYELIAGERRLRACRLIGLQKIPCRIVEVSDASSAVIALIENLQREGLNPVDESMGYASLMRDFDLTQEAVAERVGKSRPTVANALRLLQLDREIPGYLAKGHLSTGHAKVLLGLEEPTQRTVLARRIIEENLSVRDAERAIRRLKADATPARTGSLKSPAEEDIAVRDLERQLGQRLGTKVFLKHTPKRGRLVIEYYGNDDLQRILDKTGLAGGI